MADVTKGKQNVVPCTTTWERLTWTNGKPEWITIQAVDDDVYVTVSNTAHGTSAPGASYWPVPAGQTHQLPTAQLGEEVCIAAATAVNAFVWAV